MGHRNRDRSKSHRPLNCLACFAAEIEKRHGRVRADTAIIQGAAFCEIYDQDAVFQSFCPTHRNTYRLVREELDKQDRLFEDKQREQEVERTVAEMLGQIS
jgi:hypothetical protein